MNGYTGRLSCVRCGGDSDDLAPWAGCRACAAQGVAASLLPRYDLRAGLSERAGEPGLFRWRDLLPVADGAVPVSLAEGGTPLLAAPELAAELGLGELLFKDETRNPTWSYKDRLAAVAITVARARGAEVVAVASTGNHGAATAAYAAAAGLRCVVLTTASVPASMKTLMQSYGATVVALATAAQRWQVLAQAVEQWGWMPVSGFAYPPVGSHCLGVDGYKTIAYEIVRDLGSAPDVVVVPAAYGDGLAGIERGFAELVQLGMADRLPRMVAVDPFGAYRASLSQAPASPVAVPASAGTVAFSIGTPIATWQGLRALLDSGGTAAGVPDDDVIMAAQQRIGRGIGLYLEPSSAICLPGLATLAVAGEVGAGDRVVVIATSSGLKDVGATQGRLPAVPVIAPELSALAAVLRADPAFPGGRRAGRRAGRAPGRRWLRRR